MERSEWNTQRKQQKKRFFFSSIVTAACNVWWSTILVLLSFRTPTELRQQISLEVGNENTIHSRILCGMVCSYITATVFYLQRWFELYRYVKRAKAKHNAYTRILSRILPRILRCFVHFFCIVVYFYTPFWVLFSTDIAPLWCIHTNLLFMHIVPMTYSSLMFCHFFPLWIFKTFFTTLWLVAILAKKNCLLCMKTTSIKCAKLIFMWPLTDKMHLANQILRRRHSAIMITSANRYLFAHTFYKFSHLTYHLTGFGSIFSLCSEFKISKWFYFHLMHTKLSCSSDSSVFDLIILPIY